MSYDLLFRGGRIVDGSGLPSYLADIAIKDGKIIEHRSHQRRRCKSNRRSGSRRLPGVH